MADLFDKFGGVRPMAEKLGGLPPSTVMSWKRKNLIPEWRHAAVKAAAEALKVKVTDADLQNPRGAA